jgi:hypothetical protein
MTIIIVVVCMSDIVSLSRSFSLVRSFLRLLPLLFYKLNSIRDNQSPHARGTFTYIIESYQNMICTRLTMSLLTAVRLRSCWQGSTRWNPSYVLIEKDGDDDFFFGCSSLFQAMSMLNNVLSGCWRARSLFFLFDVSSYYGSIVNRDFLLLFFDSLLRGKETTNYCQ